MSQGPRIWSLGKALRNLAKPERHYGKIIIHKCKNQKRNGYDTEDYEQTDSLTVFNNSVSITKAIHTAEIKLQEHVQ